MALNEILENVPQPAQWALMAVGAAVVASKGLNFLRLILAIFLLGGANLRKYGKPGTWAVITGASDGLGKEFAMQLASKGFNLVLVSRTLSKLETLSKEIEQKFGKVQVKVVAMDYAKDSAEDYKRLGDEVKHLDIGILINNVGQSHSIPVLFLETPTDEVQNIVTINCLGTLKTTQVIAPMLVQRKRGLILTMGSFAGWMPTPYLATYSGSKAFLQHWSSALAAELKPKGVDVEFVLSYLVTTAMSKVRRPSLLIPNAKGFVKSALGKIGNGGYLPAASTYTPYWSHALFQWLVENTVGSMHPWGIWYNLKMHIDIRRRALRKAEREAKKAS